MKKYTLEELQKLVNEQAQKRGGYWPTEGLIYQMISELGELADAQNKVSGNKPVKKDSEPPNIPHELADLFYAIICFANSHKIDLSKTLLEKMGIFEERDKDRFKK